LILFIPGLLSILGLNIHLGMDWHRTGRTFHPRGSRFSFGRWRRNGMILIHLFHLVFLQKVFDTWGIPCRYGLLREFILWATK
jgi:hypothetical protein